MTLVVVVLDLVEDGAFASIELGSREVTNVPECLQHG